MAKRRMFSLSVVDTDSFIEMPLSSRLLYYELGMRADDDGFVDSWRKIIRFTGLSEDDMKVLIAKKFVIPFETGVIVIKHWRLNNYLQRDRTTETIHKEEMSLLELKDNVYELKSADNTMYTECIQNVYTDKIRLDKIRLDKNNIDNTLSESKDLKSETKKKTKHKYGEYGNVLLTDEEITKLQNDYENWEEMIKYLDEYIEMKGYKAKSHYLCIKKWVVNAVNEQHIKKENLKTDDKWTQFLAKGDG